MSPAAGKRPRVILLGLDGFPLRALSPEVTPTLWRLAAAQGRPATHGVSALPSSTYPGFATLLTGCLPARHGVRVTGPRPGAVPGWGGEQTVRGPTLLGACRAAGLRSAAIHGDHLLGGVLRLATADVKWPPDSVVPSGTPVDAHRYPTNEAVRPHLLAAVAHADLDFVFGHLNEADTLGHELGPDHSATLACVAATDALVAEVLDALREDWPRTLLVITSDHDMEAVSDGPPIRLVDGGPLDGLARAAIADGGTAIVLPADGVDERAIRSSLAGAAAIAGAEADGTGLVLVYAVAGRVFAGAGLPARGTHGGPGTACTLAIVGGGHPSVRRIAGSVGAGRPHLADWAPTIASVLGLASWRWDGRNLAAPGAVPG
jgi:arylsulfatase A-like enzyme